MFSPIFSKMKAIIKKATAADLDFIEALEGECFSLPQSRADLVNMTGEDGKHLLVAFIGERRVGYIGAYTVCRESDIMTVAVSADCRGNGVGSALVQALFDELRGESDAVFLEVRVSNSAAMALYESLGFIKVGLRKNYYKLPTEDAILYKKEL